MTTTQQELGTDFIDSKYFSVLGQIFVNSVAKSGYKSYKEIPVELLSLCRQIPFDDILIWLSPSSNPKYSALESLIVQIIINSDTSCIPKPSIAIYLRLIEAGFAEMNLVPLVIKLLTICSESEFMKYETRIFEKYLSYEKTQIMPISDFVIKQICENHRLSYHFIISYLGKKYPAILPKIQWNKLAISKGAINVIYDYKLSLTNDDIRNINTNYCSIENITLYKNKYKSVWVVDYPNLFNGIQLDDFIRVNGITDADHSKINYVKYLDVLNINRGNSNYYSVPLVKSIQKYHPDLARQFLEYILIPGDILAQTKITFAEKLAYIQEKIKTHEYTPGDVAAFINMLFYDNCNFSNSNSNSIQQIQNFDETIAQMESSGIHIPWEILITGLSNSYIDGFIKWPIARNYIIPDKRFNIKIYIRYLRSLKSVIDWTPSMQLEYLNILEKTHNRLRPQEYDELICCFPSELIIDIPPAIIYINKFYRHYGFTKLINDNSSQRSQELKKKFAKVIKCELENELCLPGTIKQLDGPSSANPNYKLKELGLIITQNYSSNLDILEYFNISGIAEVIFCVGTEYQYLSVDVLLGLITLTSSQNIIIAFRGEIERKLKEQSRREKMSEFAGLFSCEMDCGLDDHDKNTRCGVARLANATQQRPVRYWSSEDYRHACELKLITPDILSEFLRTQPVPHPDFNWRQLTILLGTDQTILAYHGLAWHLPVYSKSDSQALLKSADWDYIKTRTLLFSHDNEIWTKFSTTLPMEFILQHTNYKFQWHSIITRDDFKPTDEQWQEIKLKLRAKDLQLHPNRYSIDLIMNNLDLGWDLGKLVRSRTIPLRYLPKLLHKSRFNSSLLDDRTQQKKTEEHTQMELQNLRRKIILSSLIAGLDELKMRCRTANYLFGNRPHIEKMVLGFTTQCLLS